jgi:hypothetical protein
MIAFKQGPQKYQFLLKTKRILKQKNVKNYQNYFNLKEITLLLKMANCESDSDDKKSSYQELEKTMFDIMREMELISTKDDYDPNNYQDGSDEEEEYQSCIKVRGRPILPPLMTPGKDFDPFTYNIKIMRCIPRGDIKNIRGPQGPLDLSNLVFRSQTQTPFCIEFFC